MISRKTGPAILAGSLSGHTGTGMLLSPTNQNCTAMENVATVYLSVIIYFYSFLEKGLQCSSDMNKSFCWKLGFVCKVLSMFSEML